ncbi:MAG: efflux RND transporter periplasmic adaptor subunit [Desulfobacteraceae bacterium]|jgi:multidrug efflux pump subunit AcrA (membrane-fusion protein)
MDDRTEKEQTRRHLKIRIAVCVLILFTGIGGFLALASLKKSPAEADNGERPLKVKVLSVSAQTIPITVTGYGQVRTLNVVKLSAHVGGQVMALHPRLEVGEVIDEGELLLRIDPRDYAAAVAQSRAEVAQWSSVVQRLQKQAGIDGERLKTLERSRELARAEFERVQTLFATHSVGTRSGVDRAEQAYNASVDLADQMAQAVALYPIRIKESRSSLAAARARLGQAQVNLERCEVRALFTGRLTLATVERGQFVTPGTVLAAMADDTVLEIQVPLDSRDVRKWLRFADTGTSTTGAWFGRPEAVQCRVRWTEDKQGHVWPGTLHRVVAFDQKTRTITVAIRVQAAAARSENGGLPLVEGMFCAVEIPGKDLSNAFRVPRAAVNYTNTVFLVQGDRLKTRSVQVARVDGDDAYITGGLSNGDRVIVTRLVDPLENSLLEILQP